MGGNARAAGSHGSHGKWANEAGVRSNAYPLGFRGGRERSSSPSTSAADDEPRQAQPDRCPRTADMVSATRARRTARPRGRDSEVAPWWAQMLTFVRDDEGLELSYFDKSR